MPLISFTNKIVSKDVESLASEINISGELLFQDTYITSKDLLKLDKTPITIVNQKGENTTILINSIYATYYFISTEYNPIELSFKANYNNTESTSFVNTFIIPSDKSLIKHKFNAINNLEINVSNTNNLQNKSVDILLNNKVKSGDGTIKIRTYFTIIPSTF
jgi:hypothetical protein